MALSEIDALHPGIKTALRTDPDITRLTAIQALSIPPLLAGANALLVAQTAAGKTEAMLWPLLTRMVSSRSDSAPGVRLLIVAPLKALLNNLEERVQRWSTAVGLRCFKWHGDVLRARKLSEQDAPSEVLLTTPESLEVLVTFRRRSGAHFAPLQSMVVDEAHYFAASARGAQLMSLIERISQETGRDVQRVGLSATVGNPSFVLRWLSGSSRREQQVIQPPSTAPGLPPQIRVNLNADEAATNAQIVAACRDRRAIVFARSRSTAEQVASVFQEHNHRSPREKIEFHVHHSSVAKAHREDAERLIRYVGEEGKRTIVSTSTLELGIDIGDLDETVQLDAPPSVSSYLQRLGRTGRKPKKPRSTLVILEYKDGDAEGARAAMDDLLLTLAITQLGAAGETEELVPSQSNFGLIVQQLLCLSLQREGVARDSAYDALHRCHAFAAISRDEFVTLVEHLIATEILRHVGDLLVMGRKAEERFGSRQFRDLYSVFEAEQVYVVKHGRVDIGSVQVAYARTKEVPFVLILAGRFWEVVARDHERRILSVRPCPHGKPPYWTHRPRGFAVSRLVAQEVRRLVLAPDRVEGVQMNAHARGFLASLAAESNYPRIDHQGEEMTSAGAGAVTIWTYAGDRNNWLLARYLEAELGVQATDETFYRVTVAADRATAGVRVEDVQAAIARLRDMPDARALELSSVFAERIEAPRTTKYDDLVPKALRIVELARGAANIEHLRSAPAVTSRN